MGGQNLKKLRFICIAAAILLLLTACGSTAAAPIAEAETPAPAEPIEEAVVVVETPAPVETPTEAPTEKPTEEPTQAPEPAQEPKEGVIAVNFPDYDTGVDADYSYQSDDLRIAINVIETTMPDNTNRQLKETYYVADIWVRNINGIRTAFAKGEFDKGTEEGKTLARRENAILAVNGNYNQGLCLHGGKLLKKLRENKGWNSGAVGILYRDGSLKTFYLKSETLNIEQEIENGAWYGWQFGPIVIRDYEEGPGATRYSNMGFKARNILGYYEPGHYVIVTCDNRGEDAQGMNEFMMVDLMKSLGVKDAFNLDGGTSAVLVFMGEVINHPTTRNDNGTSVSGRPLLDMLVFGEYDENGNSPDLSSLTPAKFKGRD